MIIVRTNYTSTCAYNFSEKEMTLISPKGTKASLVGSGILTHHILDILYQKHSFREISGDSELDKPKYTAKSIPGALCKDNKLCTAPEMLSTTRQHVQCQVRRKE